MNSIVYGVAATLLLATLRATAHEDGPTQSPKQPPGGQLKFNLVDSVPVEVFQFDTAKAVVKVHNSGPTPVTVLRIDPAPGPGSGRADPEELAPGASGIIELEKPVAAGLGLHYADFYVYSTDPGLPSAPISVPVFVQSAYTPELPAFDFGAVRRSTSPTRSLKITSLEAPSLKLKAILEKPEWLTIEPAPATEGQTQTIELVATLKPSAPLGAVNRQVRVLTDLPRQPELVLAFTGHIFDRIQATPFPLQFGPLHAGKRVSKTIELRADDGKPVEIAEITQSGKDLDLETASCGDSCLLLQASLVSDQPRVVGGDIDIKFRGRDVPLHIPYGALIVAPGKSVHALGVLGNDADVSVGGNTRDPKP